MDRKQLRDRKLRGRKKAPARGEPVTAAPEAADGLTLAVQHHQAGRLDAAEAIYRRILQEQPDNSDAVHLLGVIALQRQDAATAVDRIGQAIARNDRVAAYHANLGNALRQQGRLGEAVACYRRALGLDPGDAGVHANLGHVLRTLGRPDEAMVCYRAALAVRPNFAEAHSGLGNALRDRGRLEEAIASFARALALAPGAAAVHSNLGNALRDQGRLEEAIASYGRAVTLDPGYAVAHANLGSVLRDLGRLDEALACFDRALALAPDYAEARWNRSLALLLRGDLAAGWEDYEWRWRKAGMPPPRFRQPPWDGGDLAGRTILLHAEQGLGDTIQFLRYVPLVAARGGRVVLEVQPPLLRLVRGLPGVFRLLGAGAEPVPACDTHAPLLSLPRAFRTTLPSIPAEVPYLQADAALAEAWRARLGPRRGLRVGLVWAGNPQHANDRNRSIGARHLLPLFRLPGIDWVRLQLDRRPEEAAVLPAGVVTDPTPHLTDFAETAAAVSRLDLVITVDTATAHLAGALGKPVWTLLPCVPDWRWLQDRADSPWYPTMRLFRQPAPGAWEPVIAAVAEALRSFGGNPRLSGLPS